MKTPQGNGDVRPRTFVYYISFILTTYQTFSLLILANAPFSANQKWQLLINAPTDTVQNTAPLHRTQTRDWLCDTIATFFVTDATRLYN